MSKKEIGVIGMATMGRNLALNISNQGYLVSIYNRSKEKTDKVINENSNNRISPYYNVKEFVNSLEKPRRILIMVKAGKALDDTINLILPYLSKEDILIDGGNSFYKDTLYRYKNLLKKGFHFFGVGISGGEKGALNGPSIMPGGKKEIYKKISPIFKKISAKFLGEPCVKYLGKDGSGHYVKMVHNGIEYADMQLISETYYLLKYSLKLENDDLSKIFYEWNKGELNSYLIDITTNILKKKEKQKYLIDLISDQASSKGTGKWTSQDALELGEPNSLITESVFSRYLSSLKIQRIKASKVLFGPTIKVFSKNNKKDEFIEKIRRALYFGKIIAYTQGFSQLKSASAKNNWNLNYKNIAKIFRSGCIIQAKLLQKIVDAYTEDNNIINLLLFSYFKEKINEYQYALRDVVSYSIKNGISVPTLSAAISYYDAYRSYFLPANLIQAQRDYFGSHTYNRIDKKGIFHTEW